MSEKTQKDRHDEQEDLLEQIITQGLEKISAPAAEEAPPKIVPSAPKQEDSGGTAPPADRKNRGTAVCLSLLVLSGAAFLMLLLAYFALRRGSEATINELQDTMNLSREELLAQIKELDNQNAALIGEVDRLNDDLSQLQERYRSVTGEYGGLLILYDIAREGRYCWELFWELERHYQAGELEACAALLILKDQGPYRYYAPNMAREWYTEIVRSVIDAGILDEEFDQHPDDYRYLPDAYIETYGHTYLLDAYFEAYFGWP